MRKSWKKTMMALMLIFGLCLSTACGKEAPPVPLAEEETTAETAETKAETTAENKAETTASAEPEVAAQEPAPAEDAAPAAKTPAGDAIGTVTCVKQSDLLDVYKLELLETTHVFSIREDYSSYYKLVDADLNVIADKDFIYLDGEGGFVTFALENVTNCMGLMDEKGKVLMADDYGEIDVLSDKWAAGIVLANATESNYDYYGFGGGYYLVESVDLFYCGQKVGTLGREEYNNAWAFGDFVHISDRNGTCHYYDKAFNEADPKYEYGTNEYYYESSSGTVWHLGSGTAAFTEGCTLTSDQVKCSVYNLKGSLYDLQGNVIASTAAYSTVYPFENGYAKLADSSGKYGILREDGTIISECVFDSIELYDDFTVTGYAPAEQDGKFCIVSLADGTTFTTEYAKSALDDSYAPFASKVKDDGKTMVITPTGVLEETFDEARISYTAKPLIVVGVNGSYGVIDMNGAHVIEPDSQYDYYWKLSISEDGTLVLAEGADGFYVYQLTY